MNCECISWCRIHNDYTGYSKDGIMLVTDHHENCKHYNDSLIEVYKVEYDGEYFYDTVCPDENELEEGTTIKKVNIHKEIYEQLPEFSGF